MTNPVAEELKLFMKDGYSMPEAVHCVTYTGARLLRIDEINPIALGQPANFLIARATPSMLLKNLSCLQAIDMDGKPCNKNVFE